MKFFFAFSHIKVNIDAFLEESQEKKVKRGISWHGKIKSELSGLFSEPFSASPYQLSTRPVSHNEKVD